MSGNLWIASLKSTTEVADFKAGTFDNTIPIVPSDNPSDNPSNIMSDKSINLILIDWDDTICPTTWLFSENRMEPKYRPVCVGQTVEFDIDEIDWMRRLETNCCQLFDLCIGSADSKVYIFTNSSKRWVISSINKFFPKFVPYLDKIEIYSMYDNYHVLHPNRSDLWKTHGLQDLTDMLKPFNRIKSILSIGDSNKERRAMYAVQKNNPHIAIRIIKMIKHPNCIDLNREIELIISTFQTIQETDNNLDTTIEIQTTARYT
jgi:hypothetical protein